MMFVLCFIEISPASGSFTDINLKPPLVIAIGLQSNGLFFCLVFCFCFFFNFFVEMKVVGVPFEILFLFLFFLIF